MSSLQPYLNQRNSTDVWFHCSVDPSKFADKSDIDPPGRLRYECVCLLISLETLEELADPAFPPGSSAFLERARLQPPPFYRLSRVRSRSQLDEIDLAQVNGQPYMAIVKKPESIVFKNLNSGDTSSLTIKRWWGFEDTVSINMHS